MTDRERLLEELRAAGTIDSVGQFTVDQSKALDKLRRFQLQRPEDCILKLVQAAVEAGASRIDIEHPGDELRVLCYGVALELAELEDLWGPLMGGSGWRRSLAIGLNTAVRWGHVLLINARHGDHRTLRITQEGTFQVVSGRQDCADYLEIRTCEFHLLRIIQACRLAPIPIRVEGYDVHSVLWPRCGPFWLGMLADLFADTVAIRITAFTTQRYPRFAPVVETVVEPGLRGLGLLRDGQVLQTCRAAFVQLLDPDQPSVLYAVQHGVLLRRPSSIAGLSGLEVAVCVDALPVDLSEFVLADGPQLEALYEWIGNRMAEMVRELRRQWPADRYEDALARALTDNPQARVASFV